MLAESTDRRSMRRFDMRLPAAIRFSESTMGEFFTETQNVSARGVFFYLDREVAPGSRIEVTLTFPPHITLADAVRVRFAARVIRGNTLTLGADRDCRDDRRVRIPAHWSNPDFTAAFPPQWKMPNLQFSAFVVRNSSKFEDTSAAAGSFDCVRRRLTPLRMTVRLMRFSCL